MGEIVSADMRGGRGRPGSRAGFASFVLAFTSLGLLFVLAAASGYWFQRAGGESGGGAVEPPVVLVAALAVVVALAASALVLGIVGRRKEPGNGFRATWGARIGGAVVAALVLVVVVVLAS